MQDCRNKLKRTLQLLCSPITNNIIFYIAIFCLFSISILFIEYGRCSRMRAGLEVFSDVYLLCVFVSLFPPFLRRFVKYILFSLFFFIGFIDMVCYKTMGIAMSPNILQTWLFTNINETTEAISQYFSLNLLLSPISLFFILPFLIYILKRIRFSIPQRLVGILLLITVASAIYGITNKQYLYHTYTRSSDDDMEEYKEFDTMTREYLPIYRLLFSLKEINRFSNMGHQLLENVKNTTIDSCTVESPLIVLIIGESYNKYHSSLYGYEKNSTPHQKSMAESGKLIRYNDVISSYNLTFKSFQNMLSLYNYEKKGKWYDYPLLMPLFRKAGYEVNFFSNQFCIDKSSAFSDFIEDMFINNKELNPYLFDKRNDKTHEFDNQLIDDYLQLCDTSSAKPQLNIFHFIGIHAEFCKRFPEDWNRFKSDDYNRNDLDSDLKQILADYDNAILYNDYVIKNITDVFSDKDAIIIYVPDHGELIFDNGTEFGRNMTLTKEYIKPQYDIPFWFYCTDKYVERHNNIYSKIKNSVDRPFMTDDLPHLLLYLAGIKCKDYDATRNLIDDSFNSNRKRIIQDEIEYGSW